MPCARANCILDLYISSITTTQQLKRNQEILILFSLAIISDGEKLKRQFKSSHRGKIKEFP
jgi:hypothetical protein